ncbi:MAG: hypothetical protein FWH02_05580 [Oscillospiraceae bacterium]|nr:hypothetical protein [Oscillospiraceae bacterium]
MENEILLYIEGMADKKTEDVITLEINRTVPGVELVQVNAEQGTVSVTGGDLDLLHIQDIVESLGYTVIPEASPI